MKFSDGYWGIRPGVTPLFAREVYELAADERTESLNVLATGTEIHHRGNTLNLGTFDVDVTSPAEGVVRVIARHFDGAHVTPGFDVAADVLSGQDPHAESDRPYVHVNASGAGDGETGEQGATISLTTGDFTARFTKRAPWNLDFLAADDADGADGRRITGSGNKGLAHYTLTPDAMVSASPVGEFGVTRTGLAGDESETFISFQMGLNVGEKIFGFGEQFGAYVKNGQSIDIWNEDGGTASEQAYKNVPFYMSTAGYGLLVNNRGHVSFEVGTDTTEAVQFSVPGEVLDFYVIYGPEPKTILERYTALTGRPAQVPAWSYGLWLTTSFTTKYDEKTINSFVDGMAEREIPLSAFHYDCYWMREFHWTDFVWDERYFGDSDSVKATLERLHTDKGLHICAWINPYIAQRGALFAEARDRGFLVKKPNGDVWQTDLWQAGMGIVDFTNPDAREWFKERVRALLRQGVDAIKTDFGERIPRDVVWFDGSPSLDMHNWYTQMYNQAVFEAIEEVYGKGRAVLYARSATAGGQKFPVHWGGDCESTFNGMAQTLRAGLSITTSGFGYWSHDIGGFEGAFPDGAVYKRWVAFGLLGSHSRLHGSTQYRVPWIFDQTDEERGIISEPGQTAVDVLRRFTRLKLSLMPYLYSVGLEAHRRGIPVMRSMFLEFPHDRAARILDSQYMLGPSLLVAPVFTREGDVEYYLPSGTWVNFFTGEKVTTAGGSGVWRAERHDFDSIPLWIRENSIVPVCEGAERPDYDYVHAEGLSLLVSLSSAAGSRASVTVENEAGESVEFVAVRESEGGPVRVTASDGREVSWKEV
ncbi:alpha-xylosidase [Alloscardovia macacae]|uniref:alpha-xylosidase n=1 Tax=Alloscardovia macacae TaxID=1160091 RepID=UPI000A32A65D|nr:alpha-xylosidase [Alloscardovia macacae]